MNTTVSSVDTDASVREHDGSDSYFYGSFAGSTASTEVDVSPSVFQSPSMRPPPPRGFPDALSQFVLKLTQLLEDAPSTCVFLARPLLWRQEEAEPEIEGGIFAPARERNIIFSKKLKFRLSDLPHRKSRVTITARMLDVEGDG